MERLMWVGDVTRDSGFARTTQGVLNHLHCKYQVGVLGVGYGGEAHGLPCPVWPTPPEDPLGYSLLVQRILEFRPHTLVLLNDLPAIRGYLANLVHLPDGVMPRILVHTPVEAPGLLQKWVAPLGVADSVSTYTEYGKGELRAAGYSGPLHVIPPGVDLDAFKPIDKKSARHLCGIPQGVWMVLNPNANTFRKRIDLTIKGFLDFVLHLIQSGGVEEGRKPLLHLDTELESSTGIDVLGLIQRECRWYGLKPEDWVSYTSPASVPITTEGLNYLYNSTDVGINTSLGEGKGLCALEMAALGVPQILTDCAASREFFEGRAWMLPVEQRITMPRICTEGALTSREAVCAALQEAYADRGGEYASDAQRVALSGRHWWTSVAEEFEVLIRSSTRR